MTTPDSLTHLDAGLLDDLVLIDSGNGEPELCYDPSTRLAYWIDGAPLMACEVLAMDSADADAVGAVLDRVGAVAHGGAEQDLRDALIAAYEACDPRRQGAHWADPIAHDGRSLAEQAADMLAVGDEDEEDGALTPVAVALRDLRRAALAARANAPESK